MDVNCTHSIYEEYNELGRAEYFGLRFGSPFSSQINDDDDVGTAVETKVENNRRRCSN